MAKRQLKHTDYAVGWICALPLELAAASSLLDEEHRDLARDVQDDNSYTLGCMDKHNVAIACLPAGRIGTSPATNVATQMKRKFPAMHIQVMVGIGGGVPSAEDDIRLGDVVISQPVSQYGGVVQYDMGKKGPGGRFLPTGSLNAPPTVLLTALSKLHSNYLRGRSTLSVLPRTIMHLPDSSYPGEGYDILYKAGYDHKSGSTCETCDSNEIVTRKSREASTPRLHFGTIASGNQVIKDGITRDHLSSDFVRGVCDYADSHKNKRWQPYAAAAAAACAKELLSLIPSSDVAEYLDAYQSKDATGAPEPLITSLS